MSAILGLLVLVMAFSKILFFLRIYEELGSLVQMLLVTISSLTSFTFFLSISIAFFAFSYKALGVTFDDGDYKDVPSFLIIFIQTFRNSIGDIAVLDYSSWS